MQLIRTTAMYIGCDVIAGDTMTNNDMSQSISTILFKLPLTNTAFGAINTYACQDLILFKSRQLPYSISSMNIRIYDDKFDTLELLPNSIVALEISFSYQEDGSNVL